MYIYIHTFFYEKGYEVLHTLWEQLLEEVFHCPSRKLAHAKQPVTNDVVHCCVWSDDCYAQQSTARIRKPGWRDVTEHAGKQLCLVQATNQNKLSYGNGTISPLTLVRLVHKATGRDHCKKHATNSDSDVKFRVTRRCQFYQRTVP